MLQKKKLCDIKKKLKGSSKGCKNSICNKRGEIEEKLACVCVFVCAYCVCVCALLKGKRKPFFGGVVFYTRTERKQLRSKSEFTRI